MITKDITEAIQQALKDLGVRTSEAELTHPAELSHGDYSTNVALIYAKELKMKPKELAERLLQGLTLNLQKGQTFVSRVEIAGAGFINFYLSKEFFANAVREVGDDFGKNKIRAGEKIFFEHTQPNPFKEFHIGHLMNNIIGEATSRVLEWNGAKLMRATYHGDVGLHVAKSLWGLRRMEPKMLDISVLGRAYAMGNEAYEADIAAKQDIIALNKALYAKSDPKLMKLYEEGRVVSLEHFELLYKKLGSSFDIHFFESEAGEVGSKLVREAIGSVFEESEGAVVYKGEQDGLHTRVFLNSEGLPTYEAKEVGLAQLKRKKFAYDRSITVTANEQNDFFKVVEKAVEKLFPELKGKLQHLSHGVLKLSTGKMSSRTGTIISAESLIEQVKKLVKAKVEEPASAQGSGLARREMSEKEKEELSEIVAIGAIKYSILRQAIGGDTIFDFEKSISFEGDSGPYLQYSYVRAKSVLEKAKEVLGVADVVDVVDVGNVLDARHLTHIQHVQPTTLERLLCRFPEVVERAGKEMEPHYITTYLTGLAGTFNSWYAHEKIVDASDPTSPYKVALTSAFSIVMKNGLWLLGIGVPTRM
ncbi:MAG: arginine--tRNA ligase [Candidatus Taylorbacteria bacterium RIFCSPHIGHO2_01_FULL_51_15]|uniref:Arginine--tRNA ligase n=1 Tax=Candidatus Taylorbacteria bacterium RIFCSPHIGHO2_01_FULL_51_15 TaxID=1802304 RepID=A0A1G2MBT8_9BACT|nr:MAG: arginine--tRNA ligase [Candidatus Taylorbacteria bacterium RIFCSPHIGHO2_01_FULL_51_15]